jgi:hypothetical protein
MRKLLKNLLHSKTANDRWRAYLAELAKMPYTHGEWGLALGNQAQSLMIAVIGTSFITIYKVIEPFVFFASLLVMV